MEGQVTKTCQTAWFHVYTISKISQYLTKKQKQTIIHAYVTPRLDQNNSLLGGLPLTQMNKLQLVQNSAAKIILGGKKHDHVKTTSSNYIGSPSPSGVFLRSCSSFSRHSMARGPSTWQKCCSHAPTVSTI